MFLKIVGVFRMARILLTHLIVGKKKNTKTTVSPWSFQDRRIGLPSFLMNQPSFVNLWRNLQGRQGRHIIRIQGWEFCFFWLATQDSIFFWLPKRVNRDISCTTKKVRVLQQMCINCIKAVKIKRNRSPYGIGIH